MAKWDDTAGSDIIADIERSIEEDKKRSREWTAPFYVLGPSSYEEFERRGYVKDGEFTSKAGILEGCKIEVWDQDD